MTTEAYSSYHDETMRPQHSPSGDRSSSGRAFFAIIGLSVLAWAPIVLPLVAFLGHWSAG